MHKAILLTLGASIITLLSNPVTCIRQRLTCETEDVFGDGRHSSVILHGRQNQGPPGKMGPRGLKGRRGSRGEKGDAAVVDYDRVETTLENLVDSAEGKMMTKIQGLKEKVETLNELVLEIGKVVCDGGILYRGKCFLAVVHSNFDVNYTEAVRICREKSGKPADILDAQHYNMMVEYIRSVTPSSRTWVNIWLGMNFEPSTKVVRLSNGNRAPYLKYYPGDWPSSDSTRTQMVTTVKKIESDANQGMWNWGPSSNAHGVLCQRG